jgi:hypothetical protein
LGSATQVRFPSRTLVLAPHPEAKLPSQPKAVNLLYRFHNVLSARVPKTSNSITKLLDRKVKLSNCVNMIFDPLKGNRGVSLGRWYTRFKRCAYGAGSPFISASRCDRSLTTILGMTLAKGIRFTFCHPVYGQ